MLQGLLRDRQGGVGPPFHYRGHDPRNTWHQRPGVVDLEVGRDAGLGDVRQPTDGSDEQVEIACRQGPVEVVQIDSQEILADIGIIQSHQNDGAFARAHERDLVKAHPL